MKKEAIIIGYSGHSYVVIDVLQSNGYTVLGYCDKKEKEKNPYNLCYLGDENDSAVLNAIKNTNVFIGIGDNNIRATVFKYLYSNNISCPAVAYTNSFVSLQAQIGFGSVIMPGVVINSTCKIGNAVICNSSSVIEHECVIGNYAHVASGAILAGNVTIGEKTFIGANAVIKQGVTIGSNVTIGAGAVVLKDVNDNLIIYGNPAKNKYE